MLAKRMVAVLLAAVVLLIIGNACKRDSDSPVGPGGVYAVSVTGTPTRQPGTGDVIGRVYPLSASGTVSAKQGALTVGQGVLAGNSEYYRLYNLEPGAVFVEVVAGGYDNASTSCVVVADRVSQAPDVTLLESPNLNHAWVADYGNNRVVRINGAGDTINAYIDYYGGMSFNAPNALYVDNANDVVWVSSSVSTIVKLSSNTPYTVQGSLIAQGSVVSFAVDETTGQAWVCNGADDEWFLVKSDISARERTMAAYAASNALAVALDSQGDCWLANYGGAKVHKVDAEDNPLVEYAFLVKPRDVAVDLNDDSCWVASDQPFPRLFKLTSVGALAFDVSLVGLTSVYRVDVDQRDGTCWATGFITPDHYVWKIRSDGTVLRIFTESSLGLNYPWDIAVDQSDGSVWITDLGTDNANPDVEDKVIKMNSDGSGLVTIGAGGILKQPYAIDIQQAQ